MSFNNQRFTELLQGAEPSAEDIAGFVYVINILSLEQLNIIAIKSPNLHSILKKALHKVLEEKTPKADFDISMDAIMEQLQNIAAQESKLTPTKPKV